MSGLRLFSTALAISLLTSACSLSPIENSEQATLGSEKPVNWHASGRFIYEADDQRQSGQFDWRQEDTSYQVRLFGPFGLGSVRIVGDENLVTIETSDQSYSSNYPDQLFYQLTDMQIPIQSIGDWLTGQSDSFEAQRTNWEILYDDFQPQDKYLLPNRVDLKNPEVFIRIAVSEWSLNLAD